ncbi:MAG: glycosyltransferase [Flavobacteriales bacterium]
MKKTLIILSRIPYPLEKGDKLRAYHLIKELSKWEEIHLVAISDEPAQQSSIDELKKYCKEIHVFPISKWSIALNMFKSFIVGLPFQSGYFYNSKVAREIANLIEKNKPDHIFVQLLRTTEYVKNIHGIEMTLDYMDAFAKGMERRLESAYFPASRIYRWEYFRLRKYEGRVYHWFKNKLIISEQDLNSLFIPDTNEIQIIPNGVDTAYFSPRPMEKKYDLLFFGNMSYPPNVSAARYLCMEILPLLLAKYPNIKIAISGAEPSKEVLALASKNVDITGWIDDMRDIIAQSKIVVAPMLIGTGLQNKLLQAMAMKIPCVTSSLANNALGAENKKSILVARKKEDYVKAIELMLENPEIYDSIAQNGLDFVNANFNWEASARKLHELMYGKSSPDSEF